MFNIELLLLLKSVQFSHCHFPREACCLVSVAVRVTCSLRAGHLTAVMEGMFTFLEPKHVSSRKEVANKHPLAQTCHQCLCALLTCWQTSTAPTGQPLSTPTQTDSAQPAPPNPSVPIFTKTEINITTQENVLVFLNLIPLKLDIKAQKHPDLCSMRNTVRL